jgi:xylulokinase
VENVYAEMDRQAATVPAGAEGLMVLPHFGGGGAPHWDHTWRGAIVGLGLGHTQAHVVRAILEGVAMQVRTNMDVIESLGFDIKTLRLVGGGARSALWTGIIGDVLGKPQLRIGQVEVGTLGAAMLAGLGVSAFSSVEEAVRVMVPVGAPKAFNPENHAVYEGLRRRYTETSNRLYAQPVDEWAGVAVSNAPTP